MLTYKVFDQWRRWARRKGQSRREDELTKKLLNEVR